MGYLYNHLATAVTAAFAVALSILWLVLVPIFPILEFIFIMAVPIMWFLVVMCWMAQKSADYAHRYHAEKKSLTSSTIAPVTIPRSEPTQAEIIKDAKAELEKDLEKMKDALKMKDAEIDHLRREIANLRTLIEIEALRSELAKLKMLASR